MKTAKLLMNIQTLLICLLLALPVVALSATTQGIDEEQYRCSLVIDEGDGRYQQNADQYVEMKLDKEVVHSRIHIDAASKDLTFAKCATTRNDGSNFSGWFALECRELASFDGSPYTIEAFLAGAYAGISPSVEPGYSLYATLSAAGEKLGIGTPNRTFVIYSDRKPQYEFFCYHQKKLPTT